MAMVALRPQRIGVPSEGGPWSWRVFGDRLEAWRFFYRLQDGDPAPRQLGGPHIAPDGSVIPPGSWLVIYRPIIATGGVAPAAGPRGPRLRPR
jgi:hypothetical protein